jgi:hypothetical protein
MQIHHKGFVILPHKSILPIKDKTGQLPKTKIPGVLCTQNFSNAWDGILITGTTPEAHLQALEMLHMLVAKFLDTCTMTERHRGIVLHWPPVIEDMYKLHATLEVSSMEDTILRGLAKANLRACMEPSAD